MQTSVQSGSNTKSRYARCIDASKRIRWDIDRDVIRGRRFDFIEALPARRPVPGRRARVPVAPTSGAFSRRCRAAPTRTSSAWSSASSPPRCVDVEPRPRAGRPGRVRGARPLHRRGAQAPGAVPPHRGHDRRGHARRLRLRPGAQRVAQAVLSKSTWAVLGLTCHIELFTLSCTTGESIDGEQDICPLWKDVFLFHWKEESQHAILDELEWVREDAKLAQGGARRGGRRPDRAGRRGRRHPAGAGAGRRRVLRGDRCGRALDRGEAPSVARVRAARLSLAVHRLRRPGSALREDSRRPHRCRAGRAHPAGAGADRAIGQRPVDGLRRGGRPGGRPLRSYPIRVCCLADAGLTQ